MEVSLFIHNSSTHSFPLFNLFRFARRTGEDQPVEGAVFITGCDSGMGETTAFHLAKVGYHVYAGCFLTESFKKYENIPNITPLQVDVSNEESVQQIAQRIQKIIEESNGKIKGLYGVLQCAGIAYTAPFEYIPMKAFKRQIDVNYYGYVYVTKYFLPLVKSSVLKPNSRRGRFAYVSSGPLPGPAVPFITRFVHSTSSSDLPSLPLDS
jgi:NAD(P)-dependent dehydrogenase (short-subunit alcohol dehydrogenase family)